jgi:hypothetical protein
MNNMPRKGLTVFDTHKKEVNRMLASEMEGKPGEVLAGVIVDNPIKQPLKSGEMCLFKCFNYFFLLFSVGLCSVCGIYYVDPMEAMVFTVFEKVYHVEMKPGLHWRLACCME